MAINQKPPQNRVKRTQVKLLFLHICFKTVSILTFQGLDTKTEQKKLRQQLLAKKLYFLYSLFNLSNTFVSKTLKKCEKVTFGITRNLGQSKDFEHNFQ